jgi:hypothetical protein
MGTGWRIVLMLPRTNEAVGVTKSAWNWYRDREVLVKGADASATLPM